MSAVDQAAPERIWLDSDAEAGEGMFPRCFENPKYCNEPPVEYIRADLAAPSAHAEVEGLEYAAIDAIRLEAFRTNDPDTKQRFLNAAGRWFQYETCREMDRATTLTALQAENERLALLLDLSKKTTEAVLERAEKAEAELEAEKAKRGAIIEKAAKVVEDTMLTYPSGQNASDDVAAEIRTLATDPEPKPVACSPFNFDRYINGRLMAEGVSIHKQETLEDAMAVAAKLASRGPNGEVPVLVFVPDTPSSARRP